MTDWSPAKSSSGRPPLQRSTDARIAGVSGGIGAVLGIDKNIIRVLFVVLAFVGGAGFLAYFGAWILMPAPGTLPTDGSQHERSALSMVLGGGLLCLAALLALVTAGGADPVGFVILGLVFTGVVILNRRPKSPAVSVPQPPAAPVPPTPPAPSVFDPPPPDLTHPLDRPVPDPTSELAVDDEQDRTDVLDQTDVAATIDPASGRDLLAEARAELDRELPDPTSELAPTPPPAPPLFDPSSPPAPSPVTPPDVPEDSSQRQHWAVTRTAEETSLTTGRPERVPGPPLASITLAALIAMLGVVLVFNTLAGTFVGAVATTGLATAIVGVMLAISAFVGGTARLVPLAILTVAGLAMAPTIDHAVEDGTGSSDISVATMDELQPVYRLGVGSLYLDLSDLELTEDADIDVEVGTGSLEIVLPPDAVVDVRAETVVGYVELLGEGRGGTGAELRVSQSAAGEVDGPRLRLDAKTTIGSLLIDRGRRFGG